MQVGQVSRPQEAVIQNPSTESFFNKAIKTGKNTSKKLFGALDFCWKSLTKTAALFVNSTSIAKAFTPIPKEVEYIANLSKVLSFISFPLAILAFGQEGVKLIQADSMKKRVLTTGKLLDQSGKLARGLKSFIDGLKIVGALAKTAAPWSSILGTIAFPFGVIGTGFQLYDLWEMGKFRREIGVHCSVPKDATSLKGRVKNLTKACTYVIENEEKITQKLQLSKESPMRQKIESIVKRLETANKEEAKLLVEEGEKLLQTLKGRATTQLSFKVASTALSVATVVTSGVVIFSPAAPFAPAVLGAFVIGGMGLELVKSQVLLKDPFSDEKVWYERAYEKVKKLPSEVVPLLHKVHNAASAFMQQEAAIAA